ncbi:hypothetical protein HDK77DRAFT_457083 [Phyllosticta capitalensis]
MARIASSTEQVGYPDGGSGQQQQWWRDTYIAASFLLSLFPPSLSSLPSALVVFFARVSSFFAVTSFPTYTSCAFSFSLACGLL